MRRFVVNLILLCICILTAFAAMLAFHTYEEYQKFRLPEGKHVIGVSNSHIQCGLSEEWWPGFKNFSSPGTSPWLWTSKLKAIMKMNRRDPPKCVIFDHGVQDAVLAGKIDRETDMFARYFPMSFVEGSYPYGLMSIFGKSSSLDAIFSNGALTRKWNQLPPPDMKREFDLDLSLKIHFGNTSPEFKRKDEIYIATLCELIEFALRHKMRVVFVSSPCYVEYRAMVPPACIAKRNSTMAYLQSEYPDIEYYDFYDSSAFIQEDFRDPDHLSEKGCKKFTAMLREKLDGKY